MLNFPPCHFVFDNKIEIKSIAFLKISGRMQFLNFELSFSKYFSQFNGKQDMFYLQFRKLYKVLYKSFFFTPHEFLTARRQVKIAD